MQYLIKSSYILSRPFYKRVAKHGSKNPFLELRFF